MKLKKHEILNYITYGLYVISSLDKGCVIDTVCQVTSSKEEEPIITFVINKDSETAKTINKTKQAYISVLNTKTSLDTIALFGYNHSNKVKKFDYVACNNVLGHHILTENTVGYMKCRVKEIIELGDRYLYIAKVEFRTTLKPKSKPLTYNRYKLRLKVAKLLKRK